MQVHVNSDNHIQSSIRLEQWVRSTVEQQLDRFEEDLTRIEVHLGTKTVPSPAHTTNVARWRLAPKATNRSP